MQTVQTHFRPCNKLSVCRTANLALMKIPPKTMDSSNPYRIRIGKSNQGLRNNVCRIVDGNHSLKFNNLPVFLARNCGNATFNPDETSSPKLGIKGGRKNRNRLIRIHKNSKEILHLSYHYSLS